MTNYVDPCGDLSCSTNWILDSSCTITGGELVIDGTQTGNWTDYTKGATTIPGGVSTVYFSYDVVEYTGGAAELYIAGDTNTTPGLAQSVGTHTGSVTVSDQEYPFSFKCDGWTGKIDNVYVGDVPLSDTTPPNLTSPTATGITTSSVVLGATTDEGNGIAHAIIVPNGEESTPTNQQVIDGNYGNQVAVAADLTISATGAFTFTSTSGLSSSTTYGYAIVHEDSAGNEDAGSRVEGTFTTSSVTIQTYTEVLVALGGQHLYDFDGGVTDSIGTSDGTNSGCILTDTAICEDATNCLTTNATSDRVTLPSVADINNSAQALKGVCGWFTPTAIQDPPKRIYGEGDASASFAFILGWGNNVIFEIDSANFNIQIYGDTYLESNRAYHLALFFSGNGNDNLVSAYLDGVLQLDALPVNRQPNTATLEARTVGEFGDPAGTVAVGGTAVLLNAPVNGKYNKWAFFDGASSQISGTDVREKLFEKGALPDITITSDTESNMQTALNAYSSTVRPNAPLCIRIENVSGGGDLALTADNITFDPLASIHVQWEGNGTLTWTNTNGADASIGSALNGGTIIFSNPATLTINGLIDGSEVRIYDDELADPLYFDTELSGVESNSGTSYQYSHSGVVNEVVIQVMADGYVEIIKRITLGSSDQSVTVFPEVDTNK
jgi:hypothetical protein